nr:vegetative cell wall protein gp1-like [Aegilops tauschii subsp. strangulata]
MVPPAPAMPPAALMSSLVPASPAASKATGGGAFEGSYPSAATFSLGIPPGHLDSPSQRRLLLNFSATQPNHAQPSASSFLYQLDLPHPAPELLLLIEPRLPPAGGKHHATASPSSASPPPWVHEEMTMPAALPHLDRIQDPTFSSHLSAVMAPLEVPYPEPLPRPAPDQQVASTPDASSLRMPGRATGPRRSPCPAISVSLFFLSLFSPLNVLSSSSDNSTIAARQVRAPALIWTGSPLLCRLAAESAPFWSVPTNPGARTFGDSALCIAMNLHLPLFFSNEKEQLAHLALTTAGPHLAPLGLAPTSATSFA